MAVMVFKAPPQFGQCSMSISIFLLFVVLLLFTISRLARLATKRGERRVPAFTVRRLFFYSALSATQIGRVHRYNGVSEIAYRVFRAAQP